MKFLITFEHDTLHFHFALGLTNYVASLIRLMVLAVFIWGLDMRHQALGNQPFPSPSSSYVLLILPSLRIWASERQTFPGKSGNTVDGVTV